VNCEQPVDGSKQAEGYEDVIKHKSNVLRSSRQQWFI